MVLFHGEIRLLDDDWCSHGGVFKEDLSHFTGQTDTPVAFRRRGDNAFMHPDTGVGKFHTKVHGCSFVNATGRFGLPRGIVADEGVAVGIHYAAIGGGGVINIFFQNGKGAAGGSVSGLTGGDGTPAYLTPCDVVFGFLEVGVDDNEVFTFQSRRFVPMPGTDRFRGAQLDFFRGKGVCVGNIVYVCGVAGRQQHD